MSTELTLEQVQHVARLARLALAPGEDARVREQLAAILEAVDTLSQVPTEQVPPTSHASLMEALWREDAVVPGLSNAQALANAPARADQSFAVPRIIE